jgi:hypothetical protein
MTTPPSAAGTPGYLRELKTLAQQAISQAFTITYPETDPQGGTRPVYCSLEYPVSPAAYPALWVTYAPAQLQTAGISYTENDAAGNWYARWRFSGTISFTVAALANNERDLIYDQLVSIIAFASQSQVPSTFRQFVENSPLLEVTWSYDSLESSGHSEAPGTPWGTIEVIYEDTVSIQVTGEFTSDPVSLALVPLREIIVTGLAAETGSSEPGSLGVFTADITQNSVLSPDPDTIYLAPSEPPSDPSDPSF